MHVPVRRRNLDAEDLRPWHRHAYQTRIEHIELCYICFRKSSCCLKFVQIAVALLGICAGHVTRIMCFFDGENTWGALILDPCLSLIYDLSRDVLYVIC